MSTDKSPDELLDAILRTLAKGKQRATYGAVASIVGRPQQFLMGGRPRDPYHSWVVNKETKLATGYATNEMDKELTLLDAVIDDPEQLRLWLLSHS